MFLTTTVHASSGNRVHFGRASRLMDRKLLKESIAERNHERDYAPRWDCVGYDAEWVWEHYCQRHWEKYGECFIPDVDPTWDRPTVPEPAKPIDLGENPESHVRTLVGDRKLLYPLVFSPLLSASRRRALNRWRQIRRP